jgi:hypothetical protein
MKRSLPLLLLVTLAVAFSCTDRLRAFCGFYVARADTTIFNRASQVVLVRDGDRTVMTMANDFQGDLKEFAVVIPVPTFIQKGQIHVGNKALIDHLDAYSAPRLVEYFDDNPCEAIRYERAMPSAGVVPMPLGAARRANALGVTIEAAYTVGEYDILILSATQSAGLETWLKENGYRVPSGASAVLGSYIKQDMHFFVAKVNVAEQAKTGYTYLRPIQVAYESPKFMLPIRLGMVNANGPQELFVYALTRQGRVETTNYRTAKLPTGTDVPLFVKAEFASFYKAMFDEQVRREAMRAVFLEYAWDMNWCDPCAADPLSRDELRGLGVFWLGEDNATPRGPQQPGGIRRPGPIPPQGQEVFVTRLHVRYDNAHFPDDLVFQQTGNRENFQGRYVLRHEWTGSDSCEAAARYRADLPRRREQQAQALSSMTGWPIAGVRKKMNLGPVQAPADGGSWWERLWSGQ